jgi:uncharacterized protein (TIGR02270 family)
LARFDERLAANEDGCVVAGEQALRVLSTQLVDVSAGGVFAAAVVGLDLNDERTIARCVALAETSPQALRGMTSALGWVDPVHLRGLVKDLLKARSALQRRVGLAACRLHGVDPGAALVGALTDPDTHVRAEALRTVGSLGQASSLPPKADEDPDCHFWSARSAVLLGDRGRSLEALSQIAFSGGTHRRRAFLLLCQATSLTHAHEVLRRLAGDPGQIRWVIEGSGIVGDPGYVPWLIRHMTDPKTARLAGEAFTVITGADFGRNGLTGARPEGFESGPNDDPADPNVDLDRDDGLPWPDVTKTEKWWGANRSRFPKGTRYFMGAPITREHCLGVLKNGDQRQRILAAHYLCLLEPGTPLFNTSAPARRQQRLLARLT